MLGSRYVDLRRIRDLCHAVPRFAVHREGAPRFRPGVPRRLAGPIEYLRCMASIPVVIVSILLCLSVGIVIRTHPGQVLARIGFRCMAAGRRVSLSTHGVELH